MKFAFIISVLLALAVPGTYATTRLPTFTDYPSTGAFTGLQCLEKPSY